MPNELEVKQVIHQAQETGTVERKGNVVDIKKPEGTYRLIYGSHDRPGNPQELPEVLDCFFLETANENWTQYPLNFLGKVRQFTQYQPIFRRLEEKQVPVYFVDVAVKQPEIIANVELITPVIETSIGVYMISKALRARKTELGRRRFLKLAGLSLVIFGLTPLLAIEIAHKSPKKAESAGLIKNLLRLHPEWFPIHLTLRNVIFAHKEEYVVKDPKINSSATVIGALHVGLEDYLLFSPQERLEFLRAAKPLLSTIIPETLYQGARLDFHDNAWRVGEVFEIPDLKELALGPQ